MNKCYLNLTNGIEWMPALLHLEIPFKFVRIQSTACEQKRWDRILLDLDTNFLLDLAIGHRVIVFDSSQNKNVSRALYQGIPWIEYAVNRAWFKREKNPCYVRYHNAVKYFRNEYRKLSDSTRNGLKYFRKYIPDGMKEVRLGRVSRNTELDGNYSFFKRVLHGTEKTD